MAFSRWYFVWRGLRQLGYLVGWLGWGWCELFQFNFDEAAELGGEADEQAIERGDERPGAGGMSDQDFRPPASQKRKGEWGW